MDGPARAVVSTAARARAHAAVSTTVPDATHTRPPSTAGHDYDQPISRAGIATDGAALELRVLPLGPTGVGAPIYFEVPPVRGVAAITALSVVHTASVELAVSY